MINFAGSVNEKKEKERKQKLEEAKEILSKFEMPKEQQNERTAYCLLSLLNITPEKEWKNAENPLVGITPMMNFTKEYYDKEYAPNTRETFRRFSAHQMIQAGIVCYNPDDPGRAVNSPKAVYQISPAALKVIKAYKTKQFDELLKDFLNKQPSLLAQYAHNREMEMVYVKIKADHKIQISPGKHSELIRDIIEELAPRFLPGSDLVYIGDTGEKWGYYDQDLAGNLLFRVIEHGKQKHGLPTIPPI